MLIAMITVRVLLGPEIEPSSAAPIVELLPVVGSILPVMLRRPALLRPRRISRKFSSPSQGNLMAFRNW